MQKLQSEIRQCPLPFNAVAWVAKKYSVPTATAGLIAELSGISRRNYDGLNIFPSNIPNNIAGEARLAPSPLGFEGAAQ